LQLVRTQAKNLSDKLLIMEPVLRTGIGTSTLGPTNRVKNGLLTFKK
jgi:hypothetical protein